MGLIFIYIGTVNGGGKKTPPATQDVEFFFPPKFLLRSLMAYEYSLGHHAVQFVSQFLVILDAAQVLVDSAAPQWLDFERYFRGGYA